MSDPRWSFEAMEFAMEQADKRAEFHREQWNEQRRRADGLQADVERLTRERDEARALIEGHIRASVTTHYLPSESALRASVTMDPAVARFGGVDAAHTAAVEAAKQLHEALRHVGRGIGGRP